MRKLIKWIKNLRCKHEEYITITNLSDYYSEIYGAKSIIVCKRCGKLIKSNKTQKTNINNFKGDD